MSDIVLHRGTFGDAGVSLLERIALTGLSLSSRLLEPMHFKGYGRIAAVLRQAAPQRHVVLKLNDDCDFRFPFGDAYWSRLLAASVVYEPEMLCLYRLIRDEDYCLVDCGANFGYWSVLVTGAALGNHPAIAIEASGRNVAELKENAARNGGRFEVVHAAVADIDGGFVNLGGPTHEGLAIVEAADAGPNAERAPRISLDGLLARSPLLRASPRIVLKLDVEGAEKAALQGATKLLARDALLIYEEHGSEREHANTRFVAEALGMAIFVYADGAFHEAHDPLSEVAAMKQNPHYGYNVVATRSESWLRTLRRDGWTDGSRGRDAPSMAGAR
jgi:FkbM family methyltransferase